MHIIGMVIKKVIVFFKLNGNAAYLRESTYDTIIVPCKLIHKNINMSVFPFIKLFPTSRKLYSLYSNFKSLLNHKIIINLEVIIKAEDV